MYEISKETIASIYICLFIEYDYFINFYIYFVIFYIKVLKTVWFLNNFGNSEFGNISDIIFYYL